MHIKLMYEKGFPWLKIGDSFIKGYMSNTTPEKIIEKINEISYFDEFEKIIKNIIGSFAIVINKNDRIWAAVDISRSFPIFFATECNIISDSAEEIRKYLNLNIESVDKINFIDYMLKRNSSPGETLFKEIRQLKAGQCIEIIPKNCYFVKEYYSHLGDHRKKDNDCEQNYEQKFKIATDLMMDHLSETLDEQKKIIIPLSGGYDSRFIACLLKSKGYENVICYTYGRSNDYEVINSKYVADALGYQWYFVEYNKEKWENFFSYDTSVLEYFSDTHNHCTLPHIQEYIALKELMEKGYINSGDIVIPGFCGDVPAGSFTSNINYEEYNIKTLAFHIFKMHYINFKINKKIKIKIIEKIKKYFEVLEKQVIDKDSFISAYEEWTVCSRLTMWVVNSVRVYEHFDLEWRLPMWDVDYLNFWYSIPNNERENCQLYRKILFEGIFYQYGVTLKKPDPSILHENKIRSIFFNFIKKVLIYFSAIIGKDLYKRNNINDYNDASLIMIKDMKDKSLLNYETLTAHIIEQIWWSQKVYGTTLFKYLFEK